MVRRPRHHESAAARPRPAADPWRTSARAEVPLLDLRLQYRSIRGELDAAVARVVASQHFVLGPEVDAFERGARGDCGAPHAIGIGSGVDAMLLAHGARDRPGRRG